MGILGYMCNGIICLISLFKHCLGDLSWVARSLFPFLQEQWIIVSWHSDSIGSCTPMLNCTTEFVYKSLSFKQHNCVMCLSASLILSAVLCAKPAVLKGWTGNPRVPQELSRLSAESKLFNMMWCYLPFSLSYAHRCTAEFSRSYMTCENAIPLMANEMCVLVFF